MTCPECGGQLQATKKTWYLINDTGGLIFYDHGGYHVYCENDHDFGENWEDYRDALQEIKRLGKAAVVSVADA